MLTSVLRILASTEDVKTELINTSVIVIQDMVESVVISTSTSVGQIHVNMEEFALICLTNTTASVCLDTLERTAKLTSTTVQTTLAKMEDLASIKSTHTNVSAEFRSQAEIVNRKWTLARQINVAMELAAHQVQTIKISIVHVPSDMQGDCVMKISTNVNFHLRRAEMEQHAKTPTGRTNVSVLKDMKDETVQ